MNQPMTFIDVGKTRKLELENLPNGLNYRKMALSLFCYQIGFTPQKGFNS